jgi:hypothetical protein
LRARAAIIWVALGLLGCESIIGLEPRERILDPDSGKGGADAGDAGARDAGMDAGVARDAGGGGRGAMDASSDAAADAAAGDAMAGDAMAGDAMADAAPMEVDPEALCDEYCTAVMRNCTDTNAVYASREECLSVCARLPTGDPADPTGNTVVCRLREAKAARSSDEPAFHCPEAGPGGAGECGENCEAYCQLTQAVCGATAPQGDECLRQCAGLRDLDTDGTSNRFNAERDRAGDTLQCRLVYTSASTLDPSQCWKTQIKPKPEEVTMAQNPCLGYPSETHPRCEDYCTVNLAGCQGSFKVYESRSQCLAVCEALDPGLLTDNPPNDTIGCRKTHSYNALTTDPMVHCPHAGPGGADVCGADCPAYCTLAQRACGTAFAADFANRDACISACSALRGTGHVMYSVETAEDDPNPIACRMLYATRASAGPATAEFCEAALGRGACQ